MTGPKHTRSLALGRLAVLGGTLLIAVAGCQSDGWRFAQRDAYQAYQSSPVADVEGQSYSTSKPPIVRGQFSSDPGVSTPSWNATPTASTAVPSTSSTNRYPTTNYPANNYPSTDTYSSSNQPSASVTGGARTADPNPPYASDLNPYPRMVPPLTGDAAGMGPYEPDYGPDPVVYPPIWDDPTLEMPVGIHASEAMTGRFMFGVGVNSDAGLIGSIVVDEQNFDWTKWPHSFEDIRSGRAWRGDGQRFRLEAMPGTEVHRYLVSFQEPYWRESQVSLGLSGEYYTRNYLDWNEERLGGRVALGYHFNHALTGSVAFRAMKVTLFDLVSPAPPDLLDAQGDSGLYGFQAQLAHDTRDSRFLATEGHLIEASFEQVIGTYQYPQVNLDIRKYFLLHERPDSSGRHVLSLSTRFGWTGDDTPIYEHYFAGGFSTIRGFDFRGASPRDHATGVFTGGHFMMLASAEYLFPITADDMLRGVVFCDTGTVEPSIDDWTDTYRVAPGFGLRVTVPAMGPAPIALDFAFPVSHEPGDRIENFSFFVGFLR
ncbi:MAG: BamA/TamA family outer membrane protein [Pirellulales bacterium]|nr:BamA/TamA family outer membrane protein [Pirellulales bacterium]